MKTSEHTKRHTTPPNPRPQAKVNQRVSCHAGGRQHPPRPASRHPQTRAPQRPAAVSDPRSGDGPGTPQNGLPGGSKHTTEHTTPVVPVAGVCGWTSPSGLYVCIKPLGHTGNHHAVWKGAA
jgi:hypothetical protein